MTGSRERNRTKALRVFARRNNSQIATTRTKSRCEKHLGVRAHEVRKAKKCDEDRVQLGVEVAEHVGELRKHKSEKEDHALRPPRTAERRDIEARR